MTCQKEHQYKQQLTKTRDPEPKITQRPHGAGFQPAAGYFNKCHPETSKHAFTNFCNSIRFIINTNFNLQNPRILPAVKLQASLEECGMNFLDSAERIIRSIFKAVTVFTEPTEGEWDKIRGAVLRAIRPFPEASDAVGEASNRSPLRQSPLMVDVSTSMEKKHDAIDAIGVFGCTTLLLWWLVGDRLVVIDDEGIYLDGARRLLAGSLPYRDFFALTGPGTFWNTALFLGLFGVSLASARLLLIADLALIAASIYWLTAKLQSRVIAFWLAWFYVSLLAADAGRLVLSHRWDSTALSTASVAVLFYGLRGERAWPLVVAGAAAGYAAWITPPVVLLIVPMFGWAAFEKRWTGAGLFCAGVAGVSAAAACVLFASDSLQPMVHQFLWIASQYSGANRFAYGGITGGYHALFADTEGLELLVRGYFVLFFVLPALVPLCAALGLLAARKLWNWRMLFLGLCAAAEQCAFQYWE
jgi:hypothetical protein